MINNGSFGFHEFGDSEVVSLNAPTTKEAYDFAFVQVNAVEKSPTFESWLTWLRSQVGTGVALEQQTVTFLSKVFGAVKSLPSHYTETEAQ